MSTQERREPVKATLGLTNGTVIDGTLGIFSPQDVDVRFHVDGEPAARMIPGEQISYVAFRKLPGSTDPQRADITRMALRIHVRGSQQFQVSVEPTALQNPLGFFAFPVNSESPFQRLFFYNHGVNAKETIAPIGQMLLDRGLLDKKRLDQGLAVQQEQRDCPLGNILVEKHNVSQATITEAVELQKRKPLRIGELLVEAGWLTEEQVAQALGEQKKRRGKRLGQVLVELGLVSEQVLSSTLASKFLIPLVDLEQMDIDPQAAYAIPKEVIGRHGILPIRANDKSLTIAISDPLAVDAIEEVRLHCRCKIDEVMVVPSQLRKLVTECLARLETEAMEAGMEQLLSEIEAEDQLGSPHAPKDADEASESDSTVIRLVNRIIIDAFQRGASDIHIEPQGVNHKTQVRLRIDGVCEVYQSLPSTLRRAIVTRIKIMSRLDISERRKPQDGKIKFNTRGGAIELRVATLPTLEGDEDVVMRILAASKPLPPESMNYSQGNLEQLRRILKHPYGLVLVVGPTGSGKTTTLHSVLGTLNRPEKKIWTAEDPVEITQLGLRQVQVQPKIGLDFAAVLRAFLRADPDIIMVGEMRDFETAHIGVEASLTGHLVLSTLHTNSAPETITRLIDMGLDPFSFGDALLGVLAQRLTRTLCRECRVSGPATDEEYQALRAAYGPAEFDSDLNLALANCVLWSAPGCDACRMSGYKGRIALHELLAASDDLKSAIGRKAPVDDIRAIAKRTGMKTLLQDGVMKVLGGHTDLSQVLAVCH